MVLPARQPCNFINIALMSVCLRIPLSLSFTMTNHQSKCVRCAVPFTSSTFRCRSTKYITALSSRPRLARPRLPARLMSTFTGDANMLSTPGLETTALGGVGESPKTQSNTSGGQGFGLVPTTNAEQSTSQKRLKKPQLPKGPLPPPRGSNLLIVGLGNPGDKYRMTRHNAGFLVAEELARRYEGSLKIKSMFQGEYCSVSIREKSVGILRPATYMNNSGQAARKAMDFFKLPRSAALILVDEVALEFGQLRLKPKGSAGGHNGLKSIQTHLKTPEYARLRIGVGVGSSRTPLSDHVLGEFSRSEQKELDSVIANACDAVEHWIEEDDIGKVMSRWNGQ